MYTYIQTDRQQRASLNEIFPSGLSVLLPRAMDYLKTKTKTKAKETPPPCMT